MSLCLLLAWLLFPACSQAMSHFGRASLSVSTPEASCVFEEGGRCFESWKGLLCGGDLGHPVERTRAEANPALMPTARTPSQPLLARLLKAAAWAFPRARLPPLRDSGNTWVTEPRSPRWDDTVWDPRQLPPRWVPHLLFLHHENCFSMLSRSRHPAVASSGAWSYWTCGQTCTCMGVKTPACGCRLECFLSCSFQSPVAFLKSERGFPSLAPWLPWLTIAPRGISPILFLAWYPLPFPAGFPPTACILAVP